MFSSVGSSHNRLWHRAPGFFFTTVGIQRNSSVNSSTKNITNKIQIVKFSFLNSTVRQIFVNNQMFTLRNSCPFNDIYFHRYIVCRQLFSPLNRLSTYYSRRENMEGKLTLPQQFNELFRGPTLHDFVSSKNFIHTE